MTKRFRNGVLATTVVAALAVPIMPAAPASAQTYDCNIPIIGPSHIPGEVVDCVYMILSMLADVPPHL
ncbi:MAG: hypothetical protein M3217_09640 [Actinomycetota bacterium]|nr:hypothetical protein [Actinomycetota bacterium]